VYSQGVKFLSPKISEECRGQENYLQASLFLHHIYTDEDSQSPKNWLGNMEKLHRSLEDARAGKTIKQTQTSVQGD